MAWYFRQFLSLSDPFHQILSHILCQKRSYEEKDILRKRPHYSPYCFSCHKTKKPFTPQYSPSFNGYEGLVQYNWGVLTKRGHTEREAIKVVSRCELNIPSYCQDIEITGRVIISTVGILYIEIYSFQLKSEIQPKCISV